MRSMVHEGASRRGEDWSVGMSVCLRSRELIVLLCSMTHFKWFFEANYIYSAARVGLIMHSLLLSVLRAQGQRCLAQRVCRHNVIACIEIVGV